MFAERDDLDDALLARPVEREGEPGPMIVIGASGTGQVVAAPLAGAAGTPVAGLRARLAAGGNVQRKLTVRSRVEIAARAWRTGIVTR